MIARKEALTMSSRERILNRLRTVAKDQTSASVIPFPKIPKPGNLELFIEKVVLAGAEVDRVSTSEQAKEKVQNLIQINSYKSVIASKEEIIKNLNIHKMTSTLNIELFDWDKVKEYQKAVLKADIGITSCDYAIADSGTIVLEHKSSNPRMISLAPNHHLCIMKADQIVADRYSVVSAINTKPALTSAMTFITGVSRSADIALNLVLGMHGPRKVNIIIID